MVINHGEFNVLEYKEKLENSKQKHGHSSEMRLQEQHCTQVWISTSAVAGNCYLQLISKF